MHLRTKHGLYLVVRLADSPVQYFACPNTDAAEKMLFVIAIYHWENTMKGEQIPLHRKPAIKAFFNEKTGNSYHVDVAELVFEGTLAKSLSEAQAYVKKMHSTTKTAKTGK
jgi:hypothetical protein